MILFRSSILLKVTPSKKRRRWFWTSRLAPRGPTKPVSASTTGPSTWFKSAAAAPLSARPNWYDEATWPAVIHASGQKETDGLSSNLEVKKQRMSIYKLYLQLMSFIFRDLHAFEQTHLVQKVKAVGLPSHWAAQCHTWARKTSGEDSRFSRPRQHLKKFSCQTFV